MKQVYVLVFLLMSSFASAQIKDSTKREVKLDSVVNFRDIGGYATLDGHHVKWGKIYRSAAISKMSIEDLNKLEALKIAIDADFRGPYEVAIAPDKIPANVTRISLPAGSENIGTKDNIKSMLANKNIDSSMLSFYENIDVFRDRYKPVFDALLHVDNDSAILYHCSAGKDRTGIATALILYTLGVSENTIMEDYLASNFYRKMATIKEADMMTKYFGISKEQAIQLSSVKKSYLLATFRSINNKYGSIDNFLKEELGIGPKEKLQLQTKYLY